MFANIKIGLRLAAGFAVVLLLMAGIAVVGLNGMASVENRLTEITGDNMLKISSVPTFFRGERVDWTRNPGLNFSRAV